MRNNVIFDAFFDIIANSDYICRFQSNPKLVKQLNKLIEKFTKIGNFSGSYCLWLLASIIKN